LEKEMEDAREVAERAVKLVSDRGDILLKQSTNGRRSALA
jgi:hypothetical protein